MNWSFRASPAQIVVIWLLGVRQLALGGGGFLLGQAADGAWRYLGYGLTTLMVLQLAAKPVAWFNVRYHLTEDAITERRGFLARKTTTVPLAAVATVESRASWLQGLFGVSRVTLLTAAGDGATLAVEGLRSHARLRLERAIVQAGGGHGSREGGAYAAAEVAPSASSGVTLYRAGRFDLVMMALVEFRFAVSSVVVVMAVASLLNRFDRDGVVLAQVGQRVGRPVALVVMVVLAVMAGFALAMVRLRGLTVMRQADGRLTVTHGWLTTRRRSLDPATVIGLRWRQNLLARPLGLVRLSVLSSQSQKSIALPPLPVGTVERLVISHLAGFGALPPVPVRPVLAGLSLDHQRALVVRTASCLGRVATVLQASAIQVVRTARLGRHRQLTVAYLAGRPRRLRAWRYRDGAVEQLVEYASG